MVFRAAYGILRDNSYIVIHTDPCTSHYIKCQCDQDFGIDNFFSEIIWRYRRWPTKTPNFQKMHDTLLIYRKGKQGAWNQLYEPLSESTKKTWGTKKQTAVFENGVRTVSSVGEEESKGAPLSDVWDIPIIAPIAKERTGYPTQKPLALLERLISALTNPGNTVLDPFMGSGTTLQAAYNLDRHAIGLDCSPVAIRYAKQRLGMT
jgi:site-specific DNA-methyltransferase (adenine-specific)